MSDDQLARSIAEEALNVQQEPSADARSIAESALKGNEQSASLLLEADFSPGQYAPEGLRWSLARGDTLGEKRKRLKRRFPDGEIKVLDESLVLGFDEDMLVWRESPQQQWKAVEPQGFDKFDIPEAIAPSAESIAGEITVAAATGGTSVLGTIGRQALAAMAGEAIEQGVQSATGVQEQSLAQQAGEVGTEGFWSTAGGLAMSPVSGAINIARGAGAMNVGEEGIDVLRAAGEIDPLLRNKMTPGLVVDNPAIALSERQSAALLPGLQRRYRELIDIMDNAVRSSAPGNKQVAMEETVKGLKDFGDYFLQRIRTAKTPMSKGGKALKEGIDEYSEASRNVVNELYKAAREISEPEFDLKPVYDLAGDIRKGARGQLDPAVDAQIKQLESITGPIELTDGVLSVTDQIRNIRTELWSLKHVGPGEVANQKTAQAAQLYNALTETLDNPSNADFVFRAAWKEASEAAGERLAKLEAAPIIAAAKSQNPADLVKTYVRPGQVDNLLTIRGTVPAKQWDEFVNAAYSDMLADPANLSKRLAAFDQETLDAFMPRTTQKAWKRVGRELDRINSIGADEIAERQVRNKNFIDEIVSTANPRKTQTLIRAINNTNNREMRDSVRAAIVEWAWDGVVKPTKNKLTVDSAALAKRVQMLKKNGLWSTLSADERRIIGNAEIVSRAFQNVLDAGTSIQAAEAVSGLKQLKSSAVMTFVRSDILARFYMSDLGRRVLIGRGIPNNNHAIIRALGGALAQTSTTRDISELVEEK